MGKIVALERTNKHFENVAQVQLFGSGDDTTSRRSRLNSKHIEFKELLLLVLALEYIVCPSAVTDVRFKIVCLVIWRPRGIQIGLAHGGDCLSGDVW